MTKLPNNIILPDTWPPKYKSPDKREQMSIPYLRKKPEVIPVSDKHELFVDDFIIKSRTCDINYHKPVSYGNNPVLKADKPWEFTPDGYPYAAPFSDGVWYDEEDQLFKMWYLAGGYSPAKDNLPARNSCATCYAESKDGIHWIKPELDVVPGTNIVDPLWRDSCTVWLDKNEQDRNKRYKMFTVWFTGDDIKCQIILKYSKDGIHWGPTVAQSGSISDRTTVFYNFMTKKWVVSARHQNKLSNRSRIYIEHEDPEELVSLTHRIHENNDDKHMRFWFSPDNKEKTHPDFPDIAPGIYNFDVMPYESLFIGWYSVWQGPENNICKDLMIPKRNEIQIGYSRDGFHFYRPEHDAFVDVISEEGSWNYGNMQSINGVPITFEEELYFYFSGREKNGLWWDSGMSTGLYKMRRDGFASVGGDGEHVILTERLLLKNIKLYVNIEPISEFLEHDFKVGILDGDNTINGYSLEDCITKKISSTRFLVEWKENPTLLCLTDQPLQLIFKTKNVRLYSFWTE